MKRLSFVVLLSLAVFMPTSLVTAAEVTLEQVLQRTLASHPELQSYDYRVKAAAALKLQADLSPNPNWTVELENFAGSGRQSGLSNAQMTVSFAQLVEMGNKRQYRLKAATAEEQAQLAEYHYRRIEVLAEATQRFYDLVKVQRLSQLQARHIKRTESLLALAKERVAAGAVPPSEVTRIALQHERQQAQQVQFDGERQRLKAELAAMWAAQPTFERVAGEFTVPLALPTQADVLQAVNRAPEYLRLLDSEQLLQAQVNALQADSSADLKVQAGIRYNNQFDDTGFVVSVGMPFQLSDPNLGRLKQQRILQQSNLQQQQLVRQQLRSQVLALLSGLQTHKAYLTSVTERLLPLAQQLLDENQQGYARGTHSLLQVLDAQTELAKTEYQQLSRQHALVRDMIKIERMTGQSFLGVQP